jgi:hypothetical protein
MVMDAKTQIEREALWCAHLGSNPLVDHGVVAHQRVRRHLLQAPTPTTHTHTHTNTHTHAKVSVRRGMEVRVARARTASRRRPMLSGYCGKCSSGNAPPSPKSYAHTHTHKETVRRSGPPSQPRLLPKTPDLEGARSPVLALAIGRDHRGLGERPQLRLHARQVVVVLQRRLLSWLGQQTE